MSTHGFAHSTERGVAPPNAPPRQALRVYLSHLRHVAPPYIGICCAMLVCAIDDITKPRLAHHTRAWLEGGSAPITLSQCVQLIAHHIHMPRLEPAHIAHVIIHNEHPLDMRSSPLAHALSYDAHYPGPHHIVAGLPPLAGAA